MNEKFVKKGYELLDSFPYGNRKQTRRKAFLRVKFLNNKKVFFSLFKEKMKFYNGNDKNRRFYFIQYLEDIFKKNKPKKDLDKYIFEGNIDGKGYCIVVFEKKRGKNFELQLLSIYPK